MNEKMNHYKSKKTGEIVIVQSNALEINCANGDTLTLHDPHQIIVPGVDLKLPPPPTLQPKLPASTPLPVKK